MTPYDVLEQSSLPLWMTVAAGELNQVEIPGDEDNPRIVEYHSATTLKATDDETAWCSSFVSWCLGVAGVPSTESAWARSYEEWGQRCPVDLLAPGAVVVFWRGQDPMDGGRRWPRGHVGFYVGGDVRSGTVWVLGGNQGNSVSVRGYSLDRLVGFRWPSGPLPAPGAGLVARGASAGPGGPENWA